MRTSRWRPPKWLAVLAFSLAIILVSLFFALPTVTSFLNDSPGANDTVATPASLTSFASSGSSETIALRPPDTGDETATGASLADGQTAEIRWDSITGVPAFITGSITPPVDGSPLDETLAFLSVNREIFQMNDPAAELVVERQYGDGLGMVHLQMAQVYKGIPVFGAELGVHYTADGKISTVNGNYVPGISIPIEPGITAEEAADAARSDLGFDVDPSSFEPTQLVVFAPAGSEPRLTWKVTLSSDEPPTRMVYFIDAADGAMVSRIDALENVRNRRTYTANNGSSTPGTLLITEGGSSSDTVAQTAHNNAGATYDYYFNTFGRDSFNNAGATITTTVHYGSSYNNAYWNGQQIVFGDGDGNVFSPLGSSLDVVAHELSHAVTQYSADLVYAYESGALNESYSDVFGAMVDRDDWLLGEDVYTPYTPGDALRSLSSPATYGQPEHMNDYVYTSSDNGGVHTNSGIPNKAAYNIATTIGREKTEQIWYRTLTVYLNSGSQFTDARDASVQAATDLYGASSAEVTAVQNGFAAVGIGGGQTSNQTARIEISHTYRGDLIVTLGVGDPSAPSWSTVVSNRQGGSADNVFTTVDIAGASSWLPPNWQNRWFLKVYDAAGQDTGTITKFAITDNGTTYTATDTPVTVVDYQTVYSYLPSNDDTPPTVTSVSPVNGATAYYSSNVTAEFSEDMAAASITSSSITLARHDTGAPVSATVTYDGPAKTATLDPNGSLQYSTTYDATVTTAVTDQAGNPLQQNYSWSFTTAPAPKLYYFTWYDQQTLGMNDWVVMGNPAGGSGQVGFDIFIGNQKANNAPLMVDPANATAASFNGTSGGPIRVESLDGKQEIISKRTLYGDSFEEITAMEEERLDDTYFFTWYDAQSSGSRDWILIANPSATAVEADVYIDGQKMNTTPYRVEAGAFVAPEYAGIMGGPVVVVGYEPGSPSAPRNILVSQRVLWHGNFNEVMGIPASDLGSEYLFTWYDNDSSGAQDWVLVANPSSDKQLAAEIWIGGQKMTDSATGDQYFVVPPGGSVTPRFPGVMDGPVLVRGYDAATYQPGGLSNTAMAFFTTQRVLFGTSFGEMVGYGVNRLAPSYHFSWYDQASAGSSNWVLVSNPTAGEVKAEVWIAGTKMTVLTIAPGATQTPVFPGVMTGPVEVRGYDSATYNPSSPGAPNRNIFTSQRVMWNGHFNEVEGKDLG
ncbi:MAG: M4 family metallopeptidase [Thermoleophilia bacterium]